MNNFLRIIAFLAIATSFADKLFAAGDGLRNGAEKAPAGGTGGTGTEQKKPLKCRYCDHRAVSQSALTTHERTHTGEKPFKCGYCDYRAARNSDVTAHERTHAGEKPFGCQYCEYRAATKSNVVRHERTHSGEKPFGCRFCEYRAAQKCQITKHERTHTREKPFGCQYCDYKAAQKGDVTKHERRLHPDEIESIPSSSAVAPNPAPLADLAATVGEAVAEAEKNDGAPQKNTRSKKRSRGSSEQRTNDKRTRCDSANGPDTPPTTGGGSGAASSAPQAAVPASPPFQLPTQENLDHVLQEYPELLGELSPGAESLVYYEGRDGTIYLNPDFPDHLNSGAEPANDQLADHAFSTDDDDVMPAASSGSGVSAAPAPLAIGGGSAAASSAPQTWLLDEPNPDVVPASQAFQLPTQEDVWQEYPVLLDESSPGAGAPGSDDGTIYLNPDFPVHLNSGAEPANDQLADHAFSGSGVSAAPAPLAIGSAVASSALQASSSAAQKIDVARHERRHTGEKPFGCRYCEYTAVSQSVLTIHERIHTGEKPFKCRYCEHRAANKSNITEHERIHTGDKPFGCRFCEYRAAQKSDVTKHEPTHSGEKPFGCRFCEYTATRKSNVVRHERSRHGEAVANELNLNPGVVPDYHAHLASQLPTQDGGNDDDVPGPSALTQEDFDLP